jgi:hypothetical protein
MKCARDVHRSGVPTGLSPTTSILFPTLKRGANERRASGALRFGIAIMRADAQLCYGVFADDSNPRPSSRTQEETVQNAITRRFDVIRATIQMKIQTLD